MPPRVPNVSSCTTLCLYYVGSYFYSLVLLAFISNNKVCEHIGTIHAGVYIMSYSIQFYVIFQVTSGFFITLMVHQCQLTASQQGQDQNN